MQRTVLIVDDEKAIVDILKFNLEKEQLLTLHAYNGSDALNLARERNPDLILLDVMLPGIDGFEVCRALRSEGNNIPIIMLTAREDENDKVFGLDLGADDYITKPFSMKELMARVKANIRRASVSDYLPPGELEEAFKFKEIVIDYGRRTVFKNGKNLELTQREYDFLNYLASHPGKVITRQQLLSEVWQYDYYGDLRAVDVAVRRLREKLETNPAEPEYVMTKRGVGYYFTE